MAAAIRKIVAEVEKVSKGLENANRKGKRGDVDLDNKALTAIMFDLKNALEQLVTFVGKEENICPKVKVNETRTRQLENLTDDLQQKSLTGSFVDHKQGK